MPNLPVNNSNLPTRWKWLGLNRHPFPNPHRAEYMKPEDIDDTVVLDEKDANDIKSNHSTVVLAPYGGGKTMYRRYFEEEFRQQQDTLVVFVDLRAQNKDEPITLFLLRMMANAIWEMMLIRADKFSSCSEPTQTWCWSFLRHYQELDSTDLFNRKYKVNKVKIPTPPSLKISFNDYGLLRDKPFGENTSFYNGLNRIYEELNLLGFEKIIFLVDNSDEDDERNSVHLRKSIPPFFEYVSWYSVDNIHWKWFLPKGLVNFFQSTTALQRGHIAISNIDWTEEEMMSLLENRLVWAAKKGLDKKEITGISLHGLCHKDLEAGSTLDEQLVSLALDHQEAHGGAPRTLLKLGNLLIETLPKLTNPEASKNDALIKREEWESFKKQVAINFENQISASTSDLNDTPLNDADITELSISLPVDNPQKSTTEQKSTLHKQMIDSFDDEDIRKICFELNVVYENLSGDILSAKIRALITYMDNRGRLEELVDICQQERPNLTW